MLTALAGCLSRMLDCEDIPDTVTNPFETLDQGFALLETVAKACGDVPALDAVAEQVLAMDRDDRFESSTDIVAVPVKNVDPESGVALLDELATTVQRELFIRGLLAANPKTHMVLTAAIEFGRENIVLATNKNAPERMWSTVLALGARLYRCAETGTLTDEGLREVALAEYHGHAAASEPVGDHPDTVAPLHIRADYQVYGAVLAYDTLELSLAQGAVLADESESDFAEILDAYGVDCREEYG